MELELVLMLCVYCAGRLGSGVGGAALVATEWARAIDCVRALRVRCECVREETTTIVKDTRRSLSNSSPLNWRRRPKGQPKRRATRPQLARRPVDIINISASTRMAIY